MYVVRLTREPRVNDFKPGYFPRQFRYRTDALELEAEVLNKGGEVSIEKVEPEHKRRS